MGIKAIVNTGEHAETETVLRHVRRHYITRDNLRRAIVKLVNATMAARDPHWWGAGTACASDSKKFGSWDSNLMTEWHNRYGGPGVMIYWHVERRATCIYSQLKSCSSSEVAAMIEGLLRHCTDAEIDTQYVDTHGASIVGFAFTELLGFRLLPRLKSIGTIRLHPPDDTVAYAQLGAVVGRPIRWDLIGHREHTETSMLALHLLQASLVHINTLLLQTVLEQPEHHDRLDETDRRALTPLFWTHINPYGRFTLDMNTRLGLADLPVAESLGAQGLH
jgi:TnpA family transposase